MAKKRKRETMDKVREALELLEKCAPSHFDFSGALVHHTDSKQNELRFDPYCPKCVIPKAIALIREALVASPGDEMSTKAIIQAIQKLPRYPYHTWDGGNVKDHGQQLIGLEDVIALLKRNPRPSAREKKDFRGVDSKI